MCIDGHRLFIFTCVDDIEQLAYWFLPHRHMSVSPSQPYALNPCSCCALATHAFAIGRAAAAIPLLAVVVVSLLQTTNTCFLFGGFQEQLTKSIDLRINNSKR